MKKYIVICLSLVSTFCFSQGKPRESLDPTPTEIWDLTPKVVTPAATVGDAPSDAVILFDGKNLNNWTNTNGTDAKWDLKDGAMYSVKGQGAIRTKQKFGDVQLHIEWRTPSTVIGDSQGRGNSGIFLQGLYELQVLDSYENPTYTNGQAGSIYKQAIPLVNVCRKPGEWQTYDVIYVAPRFTDGGRVITPATITVLQNGVLVQNNFTIWGPTNYKGLPVYQPHGKASLELQDHNNPVGFRNIWIREL